jgi:hypothetical protein
MKESIMRLLALAIILLICPLADAQYKFGNKVPPEEINKAKKILEQNTTPRFKWKIGTFGIFEKPSAESGKVRYYPIGDSSIVNVLEIEADTMVRLEAVKSGETEKKWHDIPKGQPYFLYQARNPGKLIVQVWANGKNGDSPNIIDTIEIEVEPDKPEPPKPPLPDPDPPKPDPPVDPKPAIFRVLFIHENDEKLTQAQLLVLNSTKMAGYLDGKTTKDGNRSGWRRWDKDINVTRESQAWQAIWSSVKPKIGELPQVAIIVDKRIDIHPLPETEAKALELLEKYGGK